MHRRYPSILPRNVGKIVLVAARTVGRALAPLGLMLGRRGVGGADSSGKVEGVPGRRTSRR